jgi:hypothetical protein
MKHDNMVTTIKKIFFFYIDGFRGMRIGKTLWKIIGIKVVLFLVIIKLLFFPNILEERFNTDTQRSEYILHQLTQGEK